MIARKPFSAAALLALLASQASLPSRAQEYPATGLPDYALTMDCMFIEYAEFSRQTELADQTGEATHSDLAQEAIGRFMQFFNHAKTLENKTEDELVTDMTDAGAALVERLRASEAPEFERRARLAGCDELAGRFE